MRLKLAAQGVLRDPEFSSSVPINIGKFGFISKLYSVWSLHGDQVVPIGSLLIVKWLPHYSSKPHVLAVTGFFAGKVGNY